MYLHVKRKDSRVVLELPTVLDRYYMLDLQFENEVVAQLIANDLDGRIDAAVKAARETAYEAGWADAKAKRKKRDYHGTWLEIK